MDLTGHTYDGRCKRLVHDAINVLVFVVLVCIFFFNLRVLINAGRRTDFRDKNRELFSGELFSGEELLPEHRFLGQ